jgi:uncharacterized membrane protein
MLLTCTSIEGPMIAAQLVPYRSYYRRYVLLVLNVRISVVFHVPSLLAVSIILGHST